MRALRYSSFGPVSTVAQLTDVERPTPGPGQVRVRVHYASIDPLDWKLVEGQFRLFARSRPPAGIGTEFSGTIDAHGSGEPAPAIGTPVLGFINPFKQPPGTLQEFVVLNAADVLPLPARVDLAAASTLPVAGLSALQMCRIARLMPGQRVLVHGAAGGVGSFAVQIVCALGAVPVATGSSASQSFLGRLQSDAVIDYEKQAVSSWPGPFDAVLDCATSLARGDAAALLADGGRYVSTLPRFPDAMLDPLANPLSRIKRHALRLEPTNDDLRVLLQWLVEGRIVPRITERFTLAEALAALARSKSGRARGKLVVCVDHEGA
jgi:NADPH:quinone reductase-like Zn-dependent oxidoreductase